MTNIDDELINALQFNDNAWIKQIIHFGNIEIEREARIGDKRWCDILVTILNYPGNEEQKVAIEVENDRQFETSAILQKIKKDQPYPTIVIIPKEHEKDAWQFQNSQIIVWCWTAECKWKCRACNTVFTTTSSITPIKCKGEGCKKGSNFLIFEGADPENIKFVEAGNNPSMTYEEIQAKLRPKGFFR